MQLKLLLAFSFKVHASGSSVEDFAKLIVSGACRGDPYVKYPSWYDIFLLYRVFTPNVLQWTFRLLLSNQSVRKTSLIGTGRPLLESSSPPRMQPIPETSSPPRQPSSESSSPRRQPLSGSSSPQHPSASPRRRMGPVPIFSSLRIVKSVAPSKPPLIICFTIRWFAPLDEPATRCPYIHIRQMICNGYW